MKTLKQAFELPVQNKDEQLKLFDKIHNQLNGNEDYTNGNIIIDLNDPNYVRIVVFEGCESDPQIVI